VASADSLIDHAFTTLLRKARQDDQALQKPLAQASTVNFHFGGSTTAVTAGQTGFAEIPFAATILSTHVYAGSALGAPVAVTTTFDLQFGQKDFFATGVLSPLHAGTLPGMTTLAEAEIDMTGWLTQIAAGDLLFCRLATFSGLATWVLVTVTLRRLDVIGLGINDLTDFAGGANIVDGSGNQIVWRQ